MRALFSDYEQINNITSQSSVCNLATLLYTVPWAIRHCYFTELSE